MFRVIVKLEYYEKWQLTQPSAPIITEIVASPGALSVIFTPPKTLGYSRILTYQYQLHTNGEWFNRVQGTTQSPLEILNLARITKYTVSLRAVDASGSVGQVSYGVAISSL